MAADRLSGRARTAQKAAEAPSEPQEPPGGNVAAVLAFVATLNLDERGEALAALAATLAATLDAGAGLALAGVSKELRAVLDDLTPPAEDDDDDFLAGLRAPVVDSTN